MLPRVDVEGCIREYIHGDGNSAGIGPLERYASFDFCFNFFQRFHEQGTAEALARPELMQASCLQLGYFLASWGMLRGAAGLLQKSVKALEPVIEEIAKADGRLWEIDAHAYTRENVWAILEFKRTLARSLQHAGGASDTLASKIMLGVFGNVPAFDNYFKTGFGVSTFGPKAIEAVGRFYAENSETIEKFRIPTLDFSTGAPTERRYTRAKVIDMIFFIEGARSGN